MVKQHIKGKEMNSSYFIFLNYKSIKLITAVELTKNIVIVLNTQQQTKLINDICVFSFWVSYEDFACSTRLSKKQHLIANWRSTPRKLWSLQYLKLSLIAINKFCNLARVKKLMEANELVGCSVLNLYCPDAICVFLAHGYCNGIYYQPNTTIFIHEADEKNGK